EPVSRPLRGRRLRFLHQPAAAHRDQAVRAPAPAAARQAGGDEPPGDRAPLHLRRGRSGRDGEFLMPSLRILVPGKGPKGYDLYTKITTLGSGADCDVALPDPLIAETYAHLHQDGGEFVIATVERKDELTVNGRKRKKHRLGHQDRLSIGAIEVVFSLFDDQ